VQIISDRNGKLSSLRNDSVEQSYSSNDKRKRAYYKSQNVFKFELLQKRGYPIQILHAWALSMHTYPARTSSARRRSVGEAFRLHHSPVNFPSSANAAVATVPMIVPAPCLAMKVSGRFNRSSINVAFGFGALRRTLPAVISARADPVVHRKFCWTCAIM